MITDFIWDFDGTLFDTYPYSIECFFKACTDLGIPCDKNEVYSLMMETIPHTFHIYEQRFTGFDIKGRYNEIRLKGPMYEGRPFPYAKELLALIKNSGRRNLMFTHRVNDVYPFLEYWNVEKYFDGIITLADGVAPKPSPDAILLLIDRFKLDKETSIMIGDREIDVLSGKNAGIKTCHITNSLPYKQFDTDIRITGLGDIYHALGGKP